MMLSSGHARPSGMPEGARELADDGGCVTNDERFNGTLLHIMRREAQPYQVSPATIRLVLQ